MIKSNKGTVELEGTPFMMLTELGMITNAVYKALVDVGFKEEFGVCITGRKDSDTPETVETKIVKDAESLSISVDGTIEEWNPMDQAGWVRRLMTAKSLGISFGGKRNYGGNDYVASRSMKTGQDCNTWVSIIFPNLDQLLVPAVIDVKSLGGDSTSIDALEWEAQSDGKPTYIAYVAA